MLDAASSQPHISKILGSLANGKDELLMDNAAIDTERANLWKTMHKLEQMVHICKGLDQKLEDKANEALEKALGKAYELSLYNEWTLAAQEQVNRFHPGAYAQVRQLPLRGSETFATADVAKEPITEAPHAEPAPHADAAQAPASAPSAEALPQPSLVPAPPPLAEPSTSASAGEVQP